MLPNWNSTSDDNDDENVTASKSSSEMDTKRDILATKLQEAEDRRRNSTMWELADSSLVGSVALNDLR